MSPESLALRLIPFRSTWAMIREPVRIVCLGAGGPARGRKPGGAPDFQLELASWDALALRLGAPP